MFYCQLKCWVCGWKWQFLNINFSDKERKAWFSATWLPFQRQSSTDGVWTALCCAVWRYDIQNEPKVALYLCCRVYAADEEIPYINLALFRLTEVSLELLITFFLGGGVQCVTYIPCTTAGRLYLQRTKTKLSLCWQKNKGQSFYITFKCYLSSSLLDHK